MTTDVDTAVSAAAASAGRLANQSLVERSAMLGAISDALDASSQELCAIAAEETALDDTRLTGEVLRTSNQLRLFAQAVTEGSWLDATVDPANGAATPRKPELRRMMIPLGPIAVYSASNFPFAFGVLGGDTASALAAGCPVVVKAHSGHPRLSAALAGVAAGALASLGEPPGVLAVVHGQQNGRELITHPQIKAGAFTGSEYAGRLLFDLAAGRPDPVPFYGELGSINPVIVGPRRAAAAPLELAQGLIASFTMGQGQFCTKPGLVFVPRGSAFIELVRSGVAVGGGRMLTQAIADSFDQTVARLLELDGVDVLCRGDAGGEDPTGRTPKAAPTVLRTDLGTVLDHHDLMLSECFGPATILVEYDQIADLDKAVGFLTGSLTATIHADAADLTQLGETLAHIRSRVGRLVFDGWPTGVTVGWGTHHGGPWPATTSALHTSVGVSALRRFLRPISYQDAPSAVLPPPLQDGNPWGIPVRFDGSVATAANADVSSVATDQSAAAEQERTRQ